MIEIFAAAASTDVARGVAYILSAAAIGFLISRLAIFAWIKRASGSARDFSPNPASVMIGMLSVPIGLFIYLVSAEPHTLTMHDLLFSFDFAGLMTAPILYVLGPIFVVYAYSRGKEISDYAVYLLSILCFGAQILWLMMLLNSME